MPRGEHLPPLPFLALMAVVILNTPPPPELVLLAATSSLPRLHTYPARRPRCALLRRVTRAPAPAAPTWPWPRPSPSSSATSPGVLCRGPRCTRTRTPLSAALRLQPPWRRSAWALRRLAMPARTSSLRRPPSPAVASGPLAPLDAGHTSRHRLQLLLHCATPVPRIAVAY